MVHPVVLPLTSAFQPRLARSLWDTDYSTTISSVWISIGA